MTLSDLHFRKISLAADTCTRVIGDGEDEGGEISCEAFAIIHRKEDEPG